MDYNFTFTEAQVNTIMQGLGELPAKMSIEIIHKIQKEATEQNQPPVSDPEK